MKKHTLKEWIATTRYWSFAVSALPAVATAALLSARYGLSSLHWPEVLLAVAGVVFFHAAGNLLSDVGDYRSGADCPEAYAIPNLVQHQFEVKEYLRLSAVLFAIGIAIGLWLTFRSGPTLLLIGGLGTLLTILYTKSKNVYLSDATVFIIFGILIQLGTGFVAMGSIHWETLLLSIPLGLITLSVLHANNIVDMATDSHAGLHTLAMALGFKHSVRLYILYQSIPFVFTLFAVAMRWIPWTALLCLIALIPAIRNIRKALRYSSLGRDAIIGLDRMSAQLQLVFSVTLSVGLFIAALI